jgi:O-antigen/teichoic acid export membrane protein
MGLARQISQNIVYRGIFLLFQLVNTILISRLAGPIGFGAYALMIVNANFLLTITSLGLPAGILFHASSRDVSKRWLLKISWVSTLIQVLLIITLEWIIFHRQGHFFVFNSTDVFNGVAGVLFTATIILSEKYYSLYNGYGYLLNYHRLLAVVNILLAVCLFAYRHSIQTNEGLVIQLFILFQMLQLVWMIMGMSEKKITSEGAAQFKPRSLWRYSFNAFVTNLLYFLLTRVDLWMVEYYHGAEALGLYALPIRLVQMALILPALLSGIVLPGIASGHLEDQVYERVFRFLNSFNLALMIPVAILAPFALPFFFGRAFESSVMVLLLLLPGALFLSAQIFLSGYFAGKGLIRYNLYSMIGGTLLALLLYISLIPVKGIYGAAIASTLGYGCSFVMSYFLYCRHASYDWRRSIVNSEDITWIRKFIKSQFEQRS